MNPLGGKAPVGAEGSYMKFFLLAAFAAVSISGCMVSARHGGLVLAPALPSLVVLEQEPYYYQSGYHYHYRNDAWFYSESRSGPWVSLPRDRYPREVRGQHGHQGRGH